jgi:hypothetical protein
MRFAPRIGHDEAALRARRQTFLKAIAVVWRNNQRPPLFSSRLELKREEAEHYADAEKHKTEKPAPDAGCDSTPGSGQVSS